MASRPKSPLQHRFGSMNGKPPVYNPGSGLAARPPPPSKAHSVPAKLHSSVGSRLNSSVTSTTDQTVKFDKENVTVTVRFRPLNSREIHQGDDAIWIPSDNTTVCNESNPSTMYSFDKVFGPATTTRGVYDVAALHVVSGAMEGINGTVFAYGVTSSGKTHTMHGDQKSPGIIPLAIKDIFHTIQETPGREYLLRVSYLEIYNEIINDLLNPDGHNLKVREDSHGTFVQGITEEVVCTPTHALSLIASGEERRHVGSNNLNEASSRSHTIFTLTIESSARGEGRRDDEVTLSQLHLIDLAGSESSKADTHGVRKKEGGYINKSLLTLGTVISKLTDGKSSHIPYRDSKLTRLLQPSLSGHGRVSLICTVTPASSSNEETHNTLKFAHRAKHVEVHSSANKILDEKSEIKRYQKMISELRQMLESSKKQLESSEKMLEAKEEEKEEEKAALLLRIQKLSKLILVSTKNSGSNVQDRPSHRRRYSFGEEELACLPDKRRGYTFEDDEDVDFDTPDGSSDGKPDSLDNGDGICKEEKKSKRRGMLDWLKPKKREQHLLSSSPSAEADVHSPNRRGEDSTPVKKNGHRNSDQLSPVVGELFADGRKPPPTGTTMTDEMDLLAESVRILDEEIACFTSSLKRLNKQALGDPNPKIQAEIRKVRDQMHLKKQQKLNLETRIKGSAQSKNVVLPSQLSQQVMQLTAQLHEKAFELEIKTADNRILQEQLQSKDAENVRLQETISSLNRQLEDKSSLMDKKNLTNHRKAYSREQNNVFDTDEGSNWLNDVDVSRELRLVEGKAEMNGLVSQGFTPKVLTKDLQSQMLAQVNEIEKLKQEIIRLKDENSQLERKCEESMKDTARAQKLAKSAAVELKELMAKANKLSLEVVELSNELEAAGSVSSEQNVQLRTDLAEATSKVAELERSLAMKEQDKADLNQQLEESKQRERDLEKDLAGMWLLLGQARNEKQPSDNVISVLDIEGGDEKESPDVDDVEQLKFQLETEKCKVETLELQNSHLKGDNLNDLDLSTLDALQNLHVEALTKLYQARSKAQERIEKERIERERKRNLEEKLSFKSQPDSLTSIGVQHLLLEEERNGNICKICYESPTAAVLLPCRHFCLCKPCATACKECPICRSEIKNKIITFTS